MVYSRAECVFILEHYFASKLSAGVRETFSNAYPDNEVPNKTTIHRLVTKFPATGSVCDREHVRRRTVLTDETLRNVEEILKKTHLSNDIDVTKAYKYCYSYGCVLSGTSCIIMNVRKTYFLRIFWVTI
jgi:hypothetical protein